MPTHLHIDVARRTMFAHVSGSITIEDILQVGEEGFIHDDWQPGFNLFVDYSAATEINVDTKDVGLLVGQYQSRSSLLVGSRCAVVAPSDLIFGLARAWELMSDGHPLTSMIFRTRRQAIAWLGLKPEADHLPANLTEQRSDDHSPEI